MKNILRLSAILALSSAAALGAAGAAHAQCADGFTCGQITFLRPPTAANNYCAYLKLNGNGWYAFPMYTTTSTPQPLPGKDEAWSVLLSSLTGIGTLEAFINPYSSSQQCQQFQPGQIDRFDTSTSGQ